MMIIRHSFQVKIAVLAAIICGTVIGTFGILLWHHIKRFGLSRIDRGIAIMANDHFDHFDHFLPHEHHRQPIPRAFLGEEFHEISIWLRDFGGRTAHRSPNWPAELTEEHLAAWTREQTEYVQHDVPENPTHRKLRPAICRTVKHGDRGWRLGSVREGRWQLHVALDLAPFRSGLHHIRFVFLVAIPLVFLITAAAGWWLARRALRPVLDVTRAAERITATSLSRRIPDNAQDREFIRLIRVLNGMLARLDHSFEQAARFSADASHELRTPLTIMQGEVETALKEVPAGSTAEQALATQLEEIHRLKALVDRLLLLSRADRGALLSRTEPFSLSDIVLATADDTRTLAPGIRVSQDIAADVGVVGDAGLVERAIQNLLANAVKYNQPDGSIHLTLECNGDEAVVRITSTGSEIDPADHDRIFDRFYRGDPARSRRIDGVGLGLSLAREIARAHRGDLVLEKSEAGRTTFALCLPVP